MSEPNNIAMSGRDRPFPWYCPKCRRKEVWRVTIPYEFECQPQGVKKTVHIDALAVPRCSQCGELVIDYEADEQIRRAVVMEQAVVDAPARPTEALTPPMAR